MRRRTRPHRRRARPRPAMAPFPPVPTGPGRRGTSRPGGPRRRWPLSAGTVGRDGGRSRRRARAGHPEDPHAECDHCRDQPDRRPEEGAGVADARSRTCSAVPARRPRRAVPAVFRSPAAGRCSSTGTACPRARSAVGATSISWAKGSRPVLGELSQAGAGNRTETIPTQLGALSLTSEIPARISSVSPGSVATAARSRPTSASISVSASACRAGSVLLVGLRGPGSRRRRSADRARRARAGRRPAGRRSAPSDGRLSSARVILTSGPRRRASRPVPTPWRSRRLGPRAPGSAPNRAVPVGGGALHDGGGVGERDLRGPLLEAAVGQRGVQGRPGAPSGSVGAGVGGGVALEGHGRQGAPGWDRRARARGRGCRRRGRPAVEQAGRRAGGAHRHRADRRPSARAHSSGVASGSTSAQRQPGHADDEDLVGVGGGARAVVRGTGDRQRTREQPGHQGQQRGRLGRSSGHRRSPDPRPSSSW